MEVYRAGSGGDLQFEHCRSIRLGIGTGDLGSDGGLNEARIFRVETAKLHESANQVETLRCGLRCQLAKLRTNFIDAGKYCVSGEFETGNRS